MLKLNPIVRFFNMYSKYFEHEGVSQKVDEASKLQWVAFA